MLYIRQLNKPELLTAYKQIKALLIKADALTVENIITALDSKVTDIEGITI